MHCSESYISPFNECPGWCWLQFSKNIPIKYPTYINMYAHTCINIKKKRIISYHTITYQSYTMHIYIYMYHVLSPVYPVYPHTIASHIFVYMYVCMSVCLSVCMHGCNVCMHGWMYVWMDGCIYVCMYVRTCVRMYVCTACMTLCWLHQFCQVLSYIGGFLKWWIPKILWLSILKWSSRTGWNGGTHHDIGNVHIACSLITTINHYSPFFIIINHDYDH